MKLQNHFDKQMNKMEKDINRVFSIGIITSIIGTIFSMSLVGAVIYLLLKVAISL